MASVSRSGILAPVHVRLLYSDLVRGKERRVTQTAGSAESVSRKVKKSRDKNVSTRKKWAGWEASWSAGWSAGWVGLRDRLIGLWPLVPSACVVAVVVLSISGLEKLKARFYDAPDYKRPLKVQLEYCKGAEWLEKENLIDSIAAVVRLPADQSLLDRNVLKEAQAQMLASGWVKRVDYVARDMDGTIRMLCDYRRPIAMIGVKNGSETTYVPVDREGFRLPGNFSYDVAVQSGYMLIQGVQCKMPPIGETFCRTATKNNDAMAALSLAECIFSQGDAALKIKAIDVSNFKGRVDPRATPVKLVARNDHEVRWGSPPGQEVEEPSVTAKLANLVLLAKQDFPQAIADVSVYRSGPVVTQSRTQ